MNALVGGIVIIVIILVGFFVLRSRGYFSGVVRDTGTELSNYSAIFVSGGGIYFGKITDDSNNFLSLEEVFSYGVVTANGTPATSGSSSADQRPTLFDASKVGIAPATKYHINKDQIILYYSLKKDSEVVKKIEEYRANPEASTATATPTAASR